MTIVTLRFELFSTTGKALDRMAKPTTAVDASFFCAQPLLLKPCSKHVYLGFIREHFRNSRLPTSSASLRKHFSPRLIGIGLRRWSREFALSTP
jgi:hypothetical protein